VIVPQYPATPTQDDADDYHGERVSDPYRWLEATDSPETASWVKAQNLATEAVLSALPPREEIRRRLAELWDYPRFQVPFERGGRWFQSRNSGLQNQPVVYLMAAPDDDGVVLLDPNTMSADGTVAVTAVEVSHDGSRLAFATSGAGSDWMTWHVRDVGTGQDLTDLVEWSKFSTVSWLRDGSGFTYTGLEPPEPGTVYLAESRLPRVWLHRLGRAQVDDELLYEAPDQPEWLPKAEVTEDGQFVVLLISRGTFPEQQIHVLDLDDRDAGLRPLVSDFDSTASVVTNVGRTFYLLTDYRADRQRLVAADLDHPTRDNWREVVGEGLGTLVEARHCGQRLVCHYLQDAHSLLRVCELDGRHVRDIPLPGICTVSEISGRPESDLLHFAAGSFTESEALFSHNLETGATSVQRPPAAQVDSGAFVTEQVFVTSADGTSVPLFLTHRRDLSPSGEVPVLLYGYGGFNQPVTPAFSVPQAVWLERGGLLAVANLRGGGEYGRNWYDAGRLANKQNVFDDFCACARWLGSAGWSRSGRIAINGRSNGGLLVGACLTQHPELFGAAVPEVGVLDMLRFHKFTIGWAWTSDFGDPDDPAQYRWLRRYSPLHNLRQGVRYPATLVMTGDHDDRVIPGHSFKFGAALQAAQGGDAPILIRVDTAAGHAVGKPTDKLIAQFTDFLTFLEYALAQKEPRSD